MGESKSSFSTKQSLFFGMLFKMKATCEINIT